MLKLFLYSELLTSLAISAVELAVIFKVSATLGYIAGGLFVVNKVVKYFAVKAEFEAQKQYMQKFQEQLQDNMALSSEDKRFFN